MQTTWLVNIATLCRDVLFATFASIVARDRLDHFGQKITLLGTGNSVNSFMSTSTQMTAPAANETSTKARAPRLQWPKGLALESSITPGSGAGQMLVEIKDYGYEIIAAVCDERIHSFNGVIDEVRIGVTGRPRRPLAEHYIIDLKFDSVLGVRYVIHNLVSDAGKDIPGWRPFTELAPKLSSDEGRYRALVRNLVSLKHTGIKDTSPESKALIDASIAFMKRDLEAIKTLPVVHPPEPRYRQPVEVHHEEVSQEQAPAPTYCWPGRVFSKPQPILEAKPRTKGPAKPHRMEAIPLVQHLADSYTAGRPWKVRLVDPVGLWIKLAQQRASRKSRSGKPQAKRAPYIHLPHMIIAAPAIPAAKSAVYETAQA